MVTFPRLSECQEWELICFIMLCFQELLARRRVIMSPVNFLDTTDGAFREFGTHQGFSNSPQPWCNVAAEEEGEESEVEQDPQPAPKRAPRMRPREPNYPPPAKRRRS